MMSLTKINPKSFPVFSKHSPSSLLSPHDELKLFNYMMDNIGDELMLVCPDGTIAYVNEATVKGLGYPRDVLLKKKVFDFFTEKIGPREWQNNYFLPLKKSKKPVLFEFERMVKGGKAETVEITAVYMRYGPGEYLLSIGRDITRRKEKEERIQETNKMKALSLFVSGTAQEIKHPLEVILNHAQEMLCKYRNRDFEYIGFKEFTGIMNTVYNISNQVRHCYDIANKLLVLNKKKAGIRGRGCSVNGVIRDAANLFMQQCTLANVTLRLRLAPTLPLAAIEVIDLDEVIMNITSNALQAMPSGGIFAIRTFYERHEKKIHVEFKDTGVGIPKENLSRVFEPFFTTKQVGPGHNAGLGLSVVSSIVKGCGGELLISSSLTSGTVVKVILPVVKDSHQPASKIQRHHTKAA